MISTYSGFATAFGFDGPTRGNGGKRDDRRVEAKDQGDDARRASPAENQRQRQPYSGLLGYAAMV